MGVSVSFSGSHSYSSILLTHFESRPSKLTVFYVPSVRDNFIQHEDAKLNSTSTARGKFVL
jgi:hypothetical protein